MRAFQVATFLLLASSLAHAHDTRSQENQAALAAAYAEIEKLGVSTGSDSIVVVQSVKKYIIVSFTPRCLMQRKCKGGTQHFAYDPALHKVVYTSVGQ